MPIIFGLLSNNMWNVRMNIGVGLYHSQNIEGALTTLPGARIVCPSFADDAAGLLRTCMRSKGFTLFLEPKALYNSVEDAAVVPEDFEVPFGKARIRREGTDLSIITYGNTTHFCLNAAERLEKEKGRKVEVIDIRSLVPLDKETIFESVKKTSKALVVHEDKVFSGFGAELAAMIGGEMFCYFSDLCNVSALPLHPSVSILFWKRRFCRMKLRSIKLPGSY